MTGLKNVTMNNGVFINYVHGRSKPVLLSTTQTFATYIINIFIQREAGTTYFMLINEKAFKPKYN